MFVSDYAQFVGREVLSLNNYYEISSSHWEETPDLFADFGGVFFSGCRTGLITGNATCIFSGQSLGQSL